MSVMAPKRCGTCRGQLMVERHRESSEIAIVFRCLNCGRLDGTHHAVVLPVGGRGLHGDPGYDGIALGRYYDGAELVEQGADTLAVLHVLRGSASMAWDDGIPLQSEEADDVVA